MESYHLGMANHKLFPRLTLPLIRSLTTGMVTIFKCDISRPPFIDASCIRRDS